MLRLKGRGLPSLRGGQGDLMVRLTVWVPERLGGAERRILEELGRAEGFRPPRPGKMPFERGKDAFAG